MNVNTKPASQKQIRYSRGSATCTCRNSMLPKASTVVWHSDTNANTPKRPRNSWCSFGYPSSIWTLRETSTLMATASSSEPTHSPNVVYSGAICEPKFSAGNTAWRSSCTGADRAEAKASGSE